jgi:hypothetical protein
MISFIVTASDDGQALARLLTSFVPAVAEGLVREVAVLGASGTAAEIAEDAGADLYDPSGFGVAFERARGPWVAGVPLAAMLARDWIEIVGAHLRREPPEPARLLARGFTLPGRAGWLVPKRLSASAGVVEQDLQRIARGGRRLRVLDRR